MPVVVVLHARGADHRTAFDTLGMDRFLRAAGYRFALASVDGGDHTYRHHRADGTDAGAMVTEEFLPLLAAHGLDTRRIGFFGWSMGGFGALWLSGVLGAGRVAAAAALSPALWHRAADTAPARSTISADFAAHDVFRHVGPRPGSEFESTAAPPTASAPRRGTTWRCCVPNCGRRRPVASSPAGTT